MLTRSSAQWFALAALLAGGPALAGGDRPNYDRLKNMLEEKFSPKDETGSRPESVTAAPSVTREAAPEAMPESATDDAASAPPAEAKKQDYQWIRPQPDAAKRDGGADGGGNQEGGWFDGMIDSAKDMIWGKTPGSSLGAPFSRFLGAGMTGFGGSETQASDVVLTGGGDAPAPVPVAKKHSYMIQLKPSATEDDIATLIKKYGFKVTKVIGALGVITVEDDGSASPVPAGPDLESVVEPSKKLELILEPPIIKALRQEPAIDAAFVNSLIEAKGLPKPSTASANSGDKTFKWQWPPAGGLDGNWALKDLRMPAIWSLIEHHRAANPNAARPKIGIIDVGFSENTDVKFRFARGAARPPLTRPDCETNHGTHVAGIIGAAQGANQGDKPGIDGIVPDAKIDAIAIAAEFISERERLGANQNWQAQAMLFSDVLSNTMFYLSDALRAGDPLRVINVSLAYNFIARGVLGGADPETVSGLKLHIAEQASVIRTMARLVENEVLFVVAAGNDSEGLAEPLNTKWASPFAWAGTYDWTSGDPVKNIIVVEAVGRDGKRASFSNTGGHVAAPGVDIMSTLGSTTVPFAVCSGTSQAAPHVTALAALIFELDPNKTPADVIALLKSSGVPQSDGGGSTPRVDALASILTSSSGAPLLRADLDGDGKVEASDLSLFSSQIASIEKAATTEAAFTEDLNGDGVIDDNECFFPKIDLNGDGEADVRPRKAANGEAAPSDLGAIEAVFQGGSDALKVAMSESGLSARIASLLVASTGDAPAAPITQCRRKDAPLVVAANTGSPTSGTGGATSATGGTTTEPSEPATPGTGPVSGGSGSTNESTAAMVDVAAVAAAQRAETEKAIADLKAQHPDLKATINPATGMISTISGFKPDITSLAAGARPAGEQSEDDTRRMVETFLNTGGLTAAFRGRSAQAELQYAGRRKDPDFPNRFIANVEQRVNGVRVFGSSAKATVENSLGVTRFQVNTSSVALADTVPSIEKDAAIAAARARLGASLRGSPTSPAPPLAMGPNPDTAEASAELVVFDPALQRAKIKGGARLAWLVAIDTYRVFVDAKSGEAFHLFRDKPTGMVRRIYDLGQASGTALVDEDGKAGAAELPTDAEQAFRYTGAVRDFFYLVLGRNSFDDNDGDGPKGGGPLESYVRYGNTRNAFWCPSKSYDCPKANVMVFGPGYAGAVDIVAHEMAHGITGHEADLVYADEPGAVNESVSDIFGSLIEFYAKGSGGNWSIGEDAPGYSLERPLRSMANPNLSEPGKPSLFDKTQNFSSANRGQPDHYGDVVSPDDALCASTWLNDNGCVHFNSGILNKFAYLIAEGGEHRGITVTGLGRMKLARLTYRTLTANLNQSSTIPQAAEGFLQSCLDLSSAKIAGFKASDCDSVMAAQQAVGLSFGS